MIGRLRVVMPNLGVAVTLIALRTERETVLDCEVCWLARSLVEVAAQQDVVKLSVGVLLFEVVRVALLNRLHSAEDVLESTVVNQLLRPPPAGVFR